MDPELIRTSKFLGLVLRHHPGAIGLTLDESGWVSIDELITAARSKGKTLDRERLLRIVHENDKQRFAISEDGRRIRANQGHSLPVNLDLTACQPPGQLFHGTVAKFVNSIRQQGLLPRSRQHVHLSADFKTAEIVGQRRGKPLVLVIDARRMSVDGDEFYLSANGVWLTRKVAPEYIRFPADLT